MNRISYDIFIYRYYFVLFIDEKTIFRNYYNNIYKQIHSFEGRKCNVELKLM